MRIKTLLVLMLATVCLSTAQAQGYLGKRLQIVYSPNLTFDLKLLHSAKLDFNFTPRTSIGLDLFTGKGEVDAGGSVSYQVENRRFFFASPASDISIRGIGGHFRAYLTGVKAPIGTYLEFAAGSYGYSFEAEQLQNRQLENLNTFPDQIVSITPKEQYTFSYGQLAFGTQSIINDRFIINLRFAYGFPFPPGSAKENLTLNTYVEVQGDNALKRNNRLQAGIGFGFLII